MNIRDLLLDVWDDLVEKRLWPVAAGLVVGLLAVPVAVGRGAGEGAQPAAAPVPRPKPASAPVVKAALPVDRKESDLGIFNPKDPFKPAVKPKTGGGAAAVSPGSSAPAQGGDVAGKTSGGDASAGSPSGSTAPPTAPTVGKRRSKLYTYVVDIKFGRVGRERRRSGVKRLEILPNDRHPVLVFLGVTADRRRAVFLVDSTTSQSGEGKCRPDLDTCTFVYLATDDEKDEHFFTDADGTEYGLHLLKIRATEVKSKSSSRSRASRERERDRRRRERRGEKTVFHFPLFADGWR